MNSPRLSFARIVVLLTSALLARCTGTSEPVDTRVVSSRSHVVAPVGVPMPIGLLRLRGGRRPAVDPDLVTWTTSDPAIVEVGSTSAGNRTVVGRAPGHASLTADYAGVQVTVPVVITDATPVEVGIDLVNGIPAGTKRRLGAYATFDDGSRYDVSAIANFSSASSDVAVVETNKAAGDDDATLRAIAPGVTEVTADLPMLAGVPTPVLVTDAELYVIEIAGASDEALLGTPVRFRAIAYYTDESTSDVTDLVTWSLGETLDGTGEPLEVDDVGHAILGDEPGVVIVTDAGTFGLFAELDGVVGHANGYSSGQSPKAIRVVGDSGVIRDLPVGLSQGLRTWFVFPDGHESSANTYVVWSTDSEHATIANANTEAVFMHTHSVGPVTLIATYGDLVGTYDTHVVDADLVSVGMWNESDLRVYGTEGWFSANAYGLFSDGMRYDISREATYASSDPASFLVDPQRGTVRLFLPGLYELTASFRGLHTTLDVASGPVTYPTYLPEVTLTVGESFDLTAMAEYANGDPVDLHRFVHWTSGDPSIATVSDDRLTRGRITAIAPGTTWMMPEYLGAQQATQVTVLPPP